MTDDRETDAVGKGPERTKALDPLASPDAKAEREAMQAPSHDLVDEAAVGIKIVARAAAARLRGPS